MYVNFEIILHVCLLFEIIAFLSEEIGTIKLHDQRSFDAYIYKQINKYGINK